MSGTEHPPDAAGPGGGAAAGPIEVTTSRESLVGTTTVRRALPTRGRRTVGSWCFVDHMGPTDPAPDPGGGVGPHPHIGLQTVTWLLRGEVLHRDGLGSEQLIRPGQLNLMTAGHGIAHAEEHTGRPGGLHGVQLWVAQPEATRHGPPAFEHHAELPQVELGPATVTVLVGSVAGATSPARRDTDHVGADVALRPGTAVLPLQEAHEHALVVVEGSVRIGGAAGGTTLEPGHLAHLPPGRAECALTASGHARLLVVGGVPFPEPVLMWWNYVARTRDEVSDAHRSWTAGDDRFATVGSRLGRIDVPPPPWAA